MLETGYLDELILLYPLPMDIEGAVMGETIEIDGTLDTAVGMPVGVVKEGSRVTDTNGYRSSWVKRWKLMVCLMQL